MKLDELLEKMEEKMNNRDLSDDYLEEIRSSTRVAPKLINPRITEVIGNEFDNPELLGGE